MSSEQMSLETLLKIYLETKDKLREAETAELEIKFGTRNIQKITKNNFDNVIQFLLANNFTFAENNKYYLSIKAEDIRTEIHNIINIQDYCKTSVLPSELLPTAYSFNEKTSFPIPDMPHQAARVNFDKFNFRITYAVEKNLSPTSPEVQELIKIWSSTKKFYRLINRFSMVHQDYPIRIDLSIVRESADKGKSFKDTNIFKLAPKYEIEIEVLNEKLGSISTKDLDVLLKKTSKYVLSGLQSTNYPVSYTELKDVTNAYLLLINQKMITEDEKPAPSNFIGPSSVTLQSANIAPINKDSNIVNIRKDYTVTDKADGERKMLYITNTGKIYLITTQLSVEFTGAETKNSKLFNTLLDGEHIKHNKLGVFINLYAAFDIYFVNGEDKRTLEFTATTKGALPNNYRWNLLDSTIKNLNAVQVNTGGLPPIRIEKKRFYEDSASQSIFAACKLINTNILANQYEYETDGFIFTPKNLGVGMTKPGQRPKSYKHTWDYSLKWKPAKYNTIDFLIRTKKTQTGTDFVGNKFEGGLDTAALDQLVQYKTVILHVGYDVRKHGYANPCQTIIDDEIPLKSDVDSEEGFKPVQFVPSNPYDPDAGLTNIELRLDNMNEKQMFTEENEVIEDNTIVEFRYDMDRLKGWRWVPLRIRYDKTAEFRAGYKNFGNAYHVAQNNWHSIHNPITIEMMTSGEGIPNELENDDIYYNQIKGPKVTKALRDFHNLFVKNKLIRSTTNAGDTLIDYAVGKGGDLPKWIHSELSFVFGIDRSRDNIRNVVDGVCARYLNYKMRFDSVPNGLFIFGDSAKNIKDQSAAFSEVGKQIIKAIFGEGPKDEKFLGKGVIKSYGKGVEGFNVSSIQFAIHYMFESPDILHNFLTNIAECTKLGGYFIGTSFNGKKIFKLLEELKTNEAYTFYDRDESNKLLEITKQYDTSEFSDNINCIGYGIDVFQASINKSFREYLVNYDYLTILLEAYGFVPLTSDEAKAINLTDSVGSFEQLYKLMQTNIKNGSLDRNEIGTAYKMTRQEQDISFLNNYFIYKKVRSVDIKDIKIGLIHKTPQEEMHEIRESIKAQQVVASSESSKAASKAASKSKSAKPKISIKKSSQSDPKLEN